MFRLDATPPPVLSDGQAVLSRVTELRNALLPHLERLRRLDQYSRRQPREWFPKAQINAPSVMLSTIRAAEKTAIAYLAGGKPAWRVASYGGYAGTGQQDSARSARDSKFERLARAIFHHLDRQSEINLLYEPVERAVRQGEIIIQFGWLPEQQRLIGDPVMGDLSGGFAVTSPDQAPLPDQGGDQNPLGQPDLGPSAGPAALTAGGLGRERGRKSRYRFPLFVRVLDRTKVFYELDPFGEPLEVYHQFAQRASQIAEAYPEWAQRDDYQPFDTLQVVEAWIGGWRAVIVQGDLIEPPRQHLYGPRPPFVIERCAPENVDPRPNDFGVVELRAGMPFAIDMLEAYEEACKSISLQRMILENSAIGAYVLKKADPRRFAVQKDGTQVEVDITMGPGTVFPLMGDEELVAAPTPPLPPALGAYFEQVAGEMASLSFSAALLRGDSQGDPSGYGIEQIRQAAMARLMPYRDAIGRSFSRLFEKLFQILEIEWAPEWGDSLTLAGEHNGEFFKETVTPEDLAPAPDHVEMTLTPAVPQNKIAEQQAIIALWQAGLKDPLSAMEEMNTPDPQEEWDSMLLHKEQLENPMVRGMAVMEIIQKRARAAGQPLPQPLGMPMPPGAAPGMPPGPGGPPPGADPRATGAPRPVGGPGLTPPGRPMPPPGMQPNRDLGQAGPPLPPAARQGARGPLPQQRPGLRPMGVPGSPNMPIPNIRTRKAPPGGR